MSLTLFTNHLGYEPQTRKIAVVRGDLNDAPESFALCLADNGSEVLRGKLTYHGQVARWRDWQFWSADFSSVQPAGRYLLRVETSGGGQHTSAPFEIRQQLFVERTLGDILSYFESQHCAGKWDEADHSIGFVGERQDRVDVHGGWYDASGDVSKYLSHLSYANFMNPQQTPLVVWAMLETRKRFDGRAAGHASLLRRLAAEAAHGGDFLVRMQDEAGYFYMTIFDRWSKDTSQREICSYKTQQGTKLESYPAGYRQGAGVSIAALARLAASGITGEFSSDRYLAVAEKGFEHLEQYNTKYLDDGKENIIDDYCALLAATELFAATGKSHYQAAARGRCERLLGRLSRDERYADFWRADDADRPFFHAAEAGFPVVALMRFHELERDAGLSRKIADAVERSLRFELQITRETVNPFGYARQYIKPLDAEKRSAFFFPHANESGYWWQGENARLSSLAAAAGLFLGTGRGSSDLRAALYDYAYDQLHWILGRNPFDVCMLHGHGRNNVEYLKEWPNAFGGICNGITGGYDDEEDIDFCRVVSDGDHSWRWSEQWIPHAAWFMLAVTVLGLNEPSA